jgi:hypothetical protein
VPNKNDQRKVYEDYLKLFDLNNNQYIIGIYQKGVTIHNQQIRALNIFYCLHQLDKINKDTRIAIIGGGFAGVTFASAALNCKMQVALFEKRPILLPLQNKCNRLIHPNIYNFPSIGSENPKTDLPILNWESGTAGKVAEDVLNEFRDIRSMYEKRKELLDNYYREILDCGKIKSIQVQGDGTYIISCTKFNIVNCDIIVYAVGFGIEKSQYQKTSSYWANTKLIQENIEDDELLISGLGDGAFMDVITSQIRNLDYQKLIDHFHSDDRKEMLVKLLTNVRKDYFEELERCKAEKIEMDPRFVHDEFESFYKRYGKDFLKEFELKEFKVVLHGRVRFEEMFQLNRASLLNSFLVFILIKTNRITYKHGKAEPQTGTTIFQIEGDSEQHIRHEKFIRHGTSRDEQINEIDQLKKGLEKAGLKDLQENTYRDGDIKQLWKDKQEYESLFQMAWYEDIPKISGNAQQTLESYTNYLALNLKEKVPSGTCFRITLHKVFEENESLYFQQVTPYAGSEPSKLHGGYGRVFNWKTGSIGYAILHRKPLLIIRKDNSEVYNKIVKNLHLEVRDEDLIDSKLKSFLALPILCQQDSEHPNDPTQRRANFVLYIDSEYDSFFDETKIFDTILSHTNVFTETFKSMVKKGQITTEDDAQINYIFSAADQDCYQNIGTGKLFGDKHVDYQKFNKELQENIQSGMVFERYYLLSCPTSKDR